MYKGRTFNRETAWICGDYMDGDVYPVFQAPGKRRKRCKPSREVQERLNAKNAEKKLTRIIHANFTPDDLTLTLTYDEEPETKERAQKDLRNFLTRLKRRYKNACIELKYISCTEHGKVNGRAHHHLIISGGVDRDEIEKLWGKGYCNSKRLQFKKNGVEGLAHYMAKDKRTKKERRMGIGEEERFKRWNGSRNLVQPQPAVFDGEYTMGDMIEIAEAIDSGNAARILEERYPDYEYIDCYWVRNEFNRGIYIHYEMRRRQ